MDFIRSEVVPTDYEITESSRFKTVLNDDHGRDFWGFTLEHAFRKAERAQDPADPIHHRMA